MPKTIKRLRTWRRLGAALFFPALLIASMGIGRAATPPSSALDVLTLSEAAALLRLGPDELERLAEKNKIPGRRIGSRWRFSRAALLAWLNGDWSLITTAVPSSANHRPSADHTGPKAPVTNLSLSPQDMAQVTATGTAVAQAQAIPKKTTGYGKKPIGEAPKERTAEDVFLRGQKVLLAPGEVSVDVGQFYSRSDSRELALVSGGVGLATVEQKTFTTSLLGRVGVLDETELFAGSSFLHQDSDAFVGSTRIADSNRTELGDIHLGVRRTLMTAGPGRPDVIATIDGRIPTGDTSYAVGGGLAFVKSIDPAVLFANANYRHTFSRDFSDLTRLEPADRLDVTMGYALALNDTLTISTSVSGLFASATSFDAATLRQQDSYSLSLGLTSWLAEGLYIEPSVSFGLSGPSDSVAFGVTLPYTF